MTDHDIAQLRGQSVAMQLMLSIFLAKICELMPEPNEFLSTIQNSLIPQISQVAPNYVQHNYRSSFESAAIATVGK